MWCCARDEGRPFGAALRGEASNRHLLRWPKTVVVSEVEKAHMMRQMWTRKTVRSPGWIGIAVEVSLCQKRHQNRGFRVASGRVWRVPVYWPGGVRHVGDVSLVRALAWNVGKRVPIQPRTQGREGARQPGLNPGGGEYRCGIRRRTGL
jgi:hypothetical protein